MGVRFFCFIEKGVGGAAGVRLALLIWTCGEGCGALLESSDWPFMEKDDETYWLWGRRAVGVLLAPLVGLQLRGELRGELPGEL